MRRSASRIAALGLAAAGWIGGQAAAQSYSFQTMDVPNSLWTGPFAINDTGDVVGYFQSSEDKKFRGFLWRRGAAAPDRTFEPPGARLTYAIGINNRREMVGWYTDEAGRMHGFVVKGETYTTIDFPDPKTFWCAADGINDDGDIVGQYNSTGDPRQPAGAGVRGFLFSKGRYTSIEVPGATTTRARGINAKGDIVGYFEDAKGLVHGFLWNKGEAAPVVIDYPGAFQTEATGINAQGAVAGRYKRSSDQQRSDWHGFVRSQDGEFVAVDAALPGVNAGYTRVRGINGAGELSGDYYDNSQRTTRGFRAQPVPSGAGRQVILVDDDGAQCPGAVTSIQKAVAEAGPGTTILVCPGLYHRTVRIAGPSKNAVRLIAAGPSGEVVLQGDHTQTDGFLLEGVSNVVLSGFTVRGFGTKATTATEWGQGNAIHLTRASYNTVENNWLIDMDGSAIRLTDSGRNAIRGNYAFASNEWLATTGIVIEGALSEHNGIRQNFLHNHQAGGISVRGVGPGNNLSDNTVVNSGGAGIDHRDSGGTWIEGNRVAFGRGYWGNTPAGKIPGVGIRLLSSFGVTVFDNRVHSNSGEDISWDGKGDNRFMANASASAAEPVP